MGNCFATTSLAIVITSLVTIIIILAYLLSVKEKEKYTSNMSNDDYGYFAHYDRSNDNILDNPPMPTTTQIKKEKLFENSGYTDVNDHFPTFKV